MPQEKRMPVFDKQGQKIGERTGAVATTKVQRDKTYAERMADEDAAKAAKKKQDDMNNALLPSPQVKRALAAATGFAK